MEAMDVYQKLSRLDPDCALSHFTYGRALYLQGQWDSALQAFMKSLKCDSDYLLAYHFAGLSQEKLASPGEAKKIYEQGKWRAQHLGDKKFVAQFNALIATLS